MFENIKEAIKSGQFKVSSDGKMKGVHLLGYKSKNKKNGKEYGYTTEAVANAAPSYKGLSIYINHDHENPSRNLEDKIGIVEEAYVVESIGLCGDVQLNTGHPMYAAVKWWAEHSPNDIGFSHTAEARFDMSTNNYTEIRNPKSVDLVATPATTNGLFAAVKESAVTEGLISDKIDERRVNLIHSAICDLFYSMYYNENKPLTQKELAVRFVPVLKDAIVELSNFAGETTQESEDMDLTKLTIEELKTARADLVTLIASEALQAEKDLTSKVSEAVKALPETAKSALFMEQVREHIKAGKDAAALVADRADMFKAVSEAAQTEKPVTTGAKTAVETVAESTKTGKSISEEDILAKIKKK